MGELVVFPYRVCADVIDGVVTKCMNARAKTRSKGIEICLMYIEIEKGDAVIVRKKIGKNQQKFHLIHRKYFWPV